MSRELLLEAALTGSIEVGVLGVLVQQVHVFEADLRESLAIDEPTRGSHEIGIASVGIDEVEVVASGVVNARVENSPSARRIPDRTKGHSQVLVSMVNYGSVGIVTAAQHHRMKEGKGHVEGALVRCGARRACFVVTILQQNVLRDV